ncbi:hypothetical protein Ddc_12631 [Ditylenchus destructor]|nr:hypothetical protein Ddc_12631 [Ditylenchus destructor]
MFEQPKAASGTDKAMFVRPKAASGTDKATQGDYNKPLIQRIKRIWASGHGIVIFRYTNDIPEQEAFDREASVLELKGYQLYNIARGRNPTYWATVYGRNFNQYEFGARNIWQAYELFKKSRAFIQRKDGAKG